VSRPDRETLEARLRERLAALDAEIAMAEGASDPVTLDQEAVGRLSRMDAIQQQAMALAARERRQRDRERVIAAIARLDTEEFGWCATCGDAIAPARLLNDPTVTRCIACAR
jgi:DnaK suppressor protein